MRKYFDTVIDSTSGTPVNGASVLVTRSVGGALAQLYSDNGTTTKTNPTTTDANGFFDFHVQNGLYVVTVSKTGMATRTFTDVLIEDPGFEIIADYTALRAYTGAQKEVSVTAPGVAGTFIRDDSDTTSGDNGGTTIVDGSSRRWKRQHDGWILADWFGAKGDGTTNDTAALNAWSAALTATGFNGRVRRAVYRVAQASMGVAFTGLRNAKIDFGGAIFKVLDGATVTGGQGGFVFSDCQDCDFYNFIYDGNRATRSPAEQYSHSILISTLLKRVRFWSCRSINAVCDGWYVEHPSAQADYPTDVALYACEGFNCFRNNMSVIGSVRFKVYGGSFNGANGTAPQAGIDCEPNSGTTYGNDNFEFHNVEVKDNVGYGWSAAGPNTINNSGRVVGLKGKNNGAGFIFTSSSFGVQIVDPVCYDHSTSTRGLIDIASGADRTSVVNPVFRDITLTGSKECIFVHSTATRTMVSNLQAYNIACGAILSFGAISVNGITVEDCTSTVPCVQIASDNSQYTNVVVKRSSERAIYVSGPKCLLSNVSVEDCSVTSNGAIRFDTTSTDSVLRGAKITQTSGSVPSGQVALSIAAILREISGVHAIGGYTTSNLWSVTAANLNGTKVANINPDPLQVTFAVSSTTYASGVTTSGNVSISGASMGDRVQVTVDQPISSLIFSGQVTATGTVVISTYNPTGSGITIAAANHKIRVLKY
jgi:hypothetical protein